MVGVPHRPLLPPLPPASSPCSLLGCGGGGITKQDYRGASLIRNRLLAGAPRHQRERVGRARALCHAHQLQQERGAVREPAVRVPAGRHGRLHGRRDAVHGRAQGRDRAPRPAELPARARRGPGVR